MSEENVEVVRQSVAVGTHPRRRLEERVALRFPRLLSLVIRAGVRLPPRSRVRQRLLRRAIQLVCEATNRRDFEAAFALATSPRYEAIPPQELISLGLDSVYRGREGRIRYHEAWLAELGDYRLEAEQIIDQGNRVLVLARAKGTGLSSEAAFDDEVALLFTLEDGQLVREENFRSHTQALEAAGLSERGEFC
jgi:ketosteroid isomerase-like protein